MSGAEKWGFSDFPIFAASAVAASAVAATATADEAAMDKPASAFVETTADTTAGRPAPPISACDSLLNSSFIILPFPSGLPQPFIRLRISLLYSFVK
jgi:hypothetical protein